MNLGEIIGALVTGVALLGGIIWRLVSIEMKVKRIPSIDAGLNQLSLDMVAVTTKVNDIWDIFLEEGRTRRSVLRASPKLSEKGKALVPEDIKQAITHYRNECHNGCEIAGHEVVCLIKKALGIERLSADAKERDMSLQEYVALLADYYAD